MLTLVFFSCGEQAEKKTGGPEEIASAQKASEATEKWIAAWNDGNAEQLEALTAADAILYSEGQKVSRDSLRSWYKIAAPMMHDLQTKVDLNSMEKDHAYQSGTYTHKMRYNDSLSESFGGAYTFVWEKADSEWKLKVINIAEKDHTTSEEETE